MPSPETPTFCRAVTAVTDKKIYQIGMHPGVADLDAFGRYITDSKHVSRYWNHIPFVFFIETELSSKELAEFLKPFLKHDYIISEIEKFNLNGLLNRAAWEWFYEPENPTFPKLPDLFGPTK